jgi:hypothetical protein
MNQLNVNDLDPEFLEYCNIVQEPEYSKQKLEEYQKKYNISDDDMQKICFNVVINYNARRKV